MRVYTKYKSTAARGSWRSLLYWLFAIVGIAFLGWVFSQSHDTSKATAQTKIAAPPSPRSAPRPLDPATRSAVAPPPNRGQDRMIAIAPTLPPAKADSELVPATRLPRAVANIFEAQLVLARMAISSGPLDGVNGSQTRSAIQAFQRLEGIPITGRLDRRTRSRLILDCPPFVSREVLQSDLDRLLPVSSTWLGKSRQPRLDYETLLELVAEKAWSHPRFIERLNPKFNWPGARAGTMVKIPNVAAPIPTRKASYLRISLRGRTLDAFDGESRLLAHFPCSIARSAAKRPRGALNVKVVIENPNYTFNPAIFPESAEGMRLGRKLVIPLGPNNPVGKVWIGLDKPGYGIHGTPVPEKVGRTTSHGCFRLANWNAEYLAKLVEIGTLVVVE